jgi:ABC-type lipoprotein export system ATPase subunit
MDNLEKNKQNLSSNPIKISNQLRKDKEQKELLDFIFSLEYVKPRYILELGGKELLQLSPGERGILLLIFYLLVDKDDCPLIIDQPEDNLDNQSVYQIVAPCIREARIKRQVFIITHNPNLAVVCDAEQVIAASIDKLNKEEVNYISGSIENPMINQKIIDILEGTQPAFKKRESKYFLKK